MAKAYRERPSIATRGGGDARERRVTSLGIQSLPVPADVELLGSRLADAPGAFLLHSAVGRPGSFLGADPLSETFGWDPEPDLGLSGCRPELPVVPRWVGLLPFEACRELERGTASRSDPRAMPLFSRCQWWRYGAVALIDDQVRVIGDDQASITRLCQRLSRPVPVRPVSIELLAEQEPDDVHDQRVQAALVEIAAGNIYQVNLARCLGLSTRGSAVELCLELGRRSPGPFGFGLDAGAAGRIFGTSPELCLWVDVEGRVVTCPIKGTRPRCGSAAQDQGVLAELDADPKERAELVMVVDLERNDLGRIGIPGSVVVSEPGALRSYATVHHRQATVEARLAPGISRESLLRHFLPSGSVTGAPKVAAMELIARLESTRRGLYTGAYGYLAHDGSLCLAMAIRTGVVGPDGLGSYHSGGGVVADSQPHRETQETHWKARQLQGRLGSAPPNAPSAAPADAENWAHPPRRGTDRDRTLR